MKDLLSYILENTIEGPFEVIEEDIDGIKVFTAKVPQEEVGKIIGKGGKTINSLKNILKIKAIKEGVRIDLQVQEA